MKRIIVVDLDGTLIKTDILLENVFAFFKAYPFRIYQIFFWLLHGKAYFKRRLVDALVPEINKLPYNEILISWLEAQRASGAKLVLATASDKRIANLVADHLGIFDEVLGTQATNLSSHCKRAALVNLFGEKGYEYVGNSRADFPVWQSANRIHVASPGIGVMNVARGLGEVGEIFDNRTANLRVFLKAFRLHQWAKNTLIFVPLLAAHRFLELPLLWSGLLAFVAFGACASSVYLLNDLLDLPDDRKHPTKRNRPLAAGTLPIFYAIVLIPVLLLGAFALALWQLPLVFAAVLAGYFFMSLGYSLWFKRIVMFDVVILAMLYTVRVIAGAAAMELVATFWILAFCMFIFLSLALVKRYTELQDAWQKGEKDKSAGRGYYPADFQLLASLGGASGYLSVMVLALYIKESASATLYKSPEWMWVACPLLLFWLSRVWLLAHRGQMHDDPIMFALRDNVSRWTGVGFLVVFALATL